MFSYEKVDILFEHLFPRPLLDTLRLHVGDSAVCLQACRLVKLFGQKGAFQSAGKQLASRLVQFLADVLRQHEGSTLCASVWIVLAQLPPTDCDSVIPLALRAFDNIKRRNRVREACEAVIILSHHGRKTRDLLRLAPSLPQDLLSALTFCSNIRCEILDAMAHLSDAYPSIAAALAGDPLMISWLVLLSWGSTATNAGRVVDALSRVPSSDVIRFGEHISDALAYLHSKGVMHRDVKPQNMLLSDDRKSLQLAGVQNEM